MKTILNWKNNFLCLYMDIFFWLRMTNIISQRSTCSHWDPKRMGWALLIWLLERSSGRHSPEHRAQVLSQSGCNRCCFPLLAFVNYQQHNVGNALTGSTQGEHPLVHGDDPGSLCLCYLPPSYNSRSGAATHMRTNRHIHHLSGRVLVCLPAVTHVGVMIMPWDM